jgi:hypothetical protein
MQDIGRHEAEDIENIVSRILRDLSEPEPPLDLEQVRSQLQLNLRYYSTANPTFLQETAHRMKLAGKELLSKPALLLDVVRKASLAALWVPSARRILIDETTPKPKHRWIEGHEIGHSIIPWHRDFLFGDDEFTLNPVCHAMVEAEANFAAAQLLFLQGRFRKEALDCAPTFASIKDLAKRYGNTITTTLWRMVQDREPDAIAFGMVTAHPHYPQLGRGPQGETIRHFIRSEGFRAKFSRVTPERAFELLSAAATRRRAGPVLDAAIALKNDNGEPHEFRVEGFSNGHALLTYGVLTRKTPTVVNVKRF